MDDLDLGPAVDAAPAPMSTDAPETFSSEREAARAMSAARRALEAPEPSPSETNKAARAYVAEQSSEEPELAKADAEPEEAPGEETEASEPEEKLPPVERPRSWAKDLDEEWSSYPREAQERIAKREQERDRAISRSQNEAAEARKAAIAEREQAEQARKQYEAQLPALLQSLQDTQQAQFADIKTMDDVERISREIARCTTEDPFRAVQLQSYLSSWQVHQMKLQSVKVEADRAEQTKNASFQSEWQSHVQKENELASEFIPELADKVKGPALTQRVATELLPDLGFNDSELVDLANGKAKLSIYDHRIQRLLADSLKLRDIQSAPKAVAPKNLPPVTRPGTAPSRGASGASKVQALQKQLDNATGLQAVRLSAELLRARRG